jgi:5-methylcytosine-specific restriction endonuclease McrA
MKKVIKSHYGRKSILKGYCHTCKCYSFIIDKKLQCCDSPVTFDKDVKIKSINEITLSGKRKPLRKKYKLEILKNQSYKCFYCGEDLIESNAHFDHVVPFVLTLSCAKEEFVAACKECNLLKSDSIFNTIFDIKEYLIKEKEKRKNGR